MPHMVMPPGERHGVGGGLRSLTAFLVTYLFTFIQILPKILNFRNVCCESYRQETNLFRFV